MSEFQLSVERSKLVKGLGWNKLKGLGVMFRGGLGTCATREMNDLIRCMPDGGGGSHVTKMNSQRSDPMRTVVDHRWRWKSEGYLLVLQSAQTRQVAGGQRQRPQAGIERQVEAESGGQKSRVNGGGCTAPAERVEIAKRWGWC